jgi:hypothetical protein
MIQMDLFYAKNASLLLDLEILARTGTVLAHQLIGGQQSFTKLGVEQGNERYGNQLQRTKSLPPAAN